MGAYRYKGGKVTLIVSNIDKVEALIRAIEGASLPDKQMLQEELKSLRNPVIVDTIVHRERIKNTKK